LDVRRFCCFFWQVTIFLGCGFAAKYRQGGGNFSVPLQWMLGLRRLKVDAIWLEVLPSSGEEKGDRASIRNFVQQLRLHGLANRYCLLYQRPSADEHDLARFECIGMSRRSLTDRLAGPNTLLNLSYSIHPPLLLGFERRIFCDLDPSEIFYWMTKMELGQSSHHEFWTIGLNVHGPDCELPETVTAPVSAADAASPATRLPLQKKKKETIRWKTFYPLVDTTYFRAQPRPRASRFTTIGQWYWGGAVEVAGDFPDLSKKHTFAPYLDLPRHVSNARFELAMNISVNDPEHQRLQKHGWTMVDPHRVARTPRLYRRYLSRALAEFTAIKGVDVAWRTGWLSDRAAAFLALGRPVITEDTGAKAHLPNHSGFRFVGDLAGAIEAVSEVMSDWPKLSKQARACAIEVFEAEKNARKILGL
jgi:hypothetical protein